MQLTAERTSCKENKECQLDGNGMICNNRSGKCGCPAYHTLKGCKCQQGMYD